MTLRYEAVEFLGREAAEAAIRRDVAAELLYVPLQVSLHATDPAWAEEICVRLAAHRVPNVRGNAVLGFGHLARRFGKLDRARVEPLVRAALRDADAFVRGQASSAADDVQHFLGWDLGT